MANALGNLTLTNACNTLTAQAWATGQSLNVTAVQAGSGFPGPHDNVELYTALKTPVMNGIITGVNDVIPGQLTVRANFSSANAPSTFDLNEAGIYASVGGGTSQLIAYCTTGSDVGQTISPTGGGTPFVLDYAFLVVFLQNIFTSGIIQLTQAVGLHAPSHISTGVDPIAVMNTTTTGLGPVAPGDASLFLNGAVGWSTPVQVGTMMLWPGIVPPTGGWFPCDVLRVLSVSSYPLLFGVIGFKYNFQNNGAPPGFFVIPKLADVVVDPSFPSVTMAWYIKHD